MALNHDAYAFDVDAFIAEVEPLLGGARANNLRGAALAAFDANPTVRRLADRYGGWDHDALAAEDADDVPFWLVLLLYAHLEGDGSAGLGGDWRELSQHHEALNLSEDDARLLTRGRNLGELGVGGSALAGLGPPSTGASAGWIGADDALGILNALEAARPSPLRDACAHMLAHAPLCVIVSG